jgi:hypothetical protein
MSGIVLSQNPVSWQVRFLVQEVWHGDLDFEGIRMAWQ